MNDTDRITLMYMTSGRHRSLIEQAAVACLARGAGQGPTSR
jgi:hypothetical protein